jgi:hypothetical protein
MLRIWKEAAVASSRYSLEGKGSEKNHGKPQSGQLVSGWRFETSPSKIQLYSASSRTTCSVCAGLTYRFAKF